MEKTILKEIKEIKDFHKNVNKGVSIFGSARTQENSDAYNITKELSRSLAENGYQVISGGGPGIMKAAIEGSYLSGKKSIALNLKLPFEENILADKKESLNFDYFMTRKLAFAKYSDAFIVMQGGFGTLDELFEILTLIQTNKMKSKKVILFGSIFWAGLMSWIEGTLLIQKLINKADLQNIFIVNSIDEALHKLKEGK